MASSSDGITGNGRHEELFKEIVIENNKRGFKCTTCQRVLSRQQTIESHLRLVHDYRGPKIFKRKYKLYHEDANVKIPRQTIHWQKQKRDKLGQFDSNHYSVSSFNDHDLPAVSFTVIPPNFTDQHFEMVARRQLNSNSFQPTFDNNDTQEPICIDNDTLDSEVDNPVDNQAISDIEKSTQELITANSISDELSSTESDFSLSSSSSEDSESENQSETSDDSDLEESADEADVDKETQSELQSVSMAIMSYMSRHCITREAAKDMIELMKVLCPDKDIIQSLNINVVQEVCGLCEVTVYDICETCLRLFPDDKQSYYCSTDGCSQLRYKGNLTEQSKKRQKSGFATVNISKQLKSLLERDGIWTTIQKRIANRGKDILTDIIDGKYYKEACKDGNFLSNTNNISLIFNTDGAPLYSSSNVSLWPVFLAINELPSPDRFAKENMLMWGIWQGKGKPPFNVFFEPFASDMTKLYQQGLKVIPNKHVCSVSVKAAVLLGATDLQGKAYLLNMTHHNGQNGCVTCEEPGIVVKQGKGHTRCYPYKPTTEAATKRTCSSFLHDALKGNQCKSMVNGVYDVTSLALMEWFDIVLGIVPDYMHGCLLGITKTLLHKWLSSKNHKKPYFVGGQISKINKRLKEMKPPDSLARLPRDLEKHFKNLKASELQAWLLYYSLPCLIGFLADKYLQHFARFAEGIYLLLGDSITPTHLARARDLLNTFYRDFKDLYGEGSIGLNVHNAGAHLVDYVEGWGPLWAWFTFGFEDMNGTLMDFTHGTGNVCRQLIWMLHAVSRLRFEVAFLPECNIKQFIQQMLNTKRQVSNLKEATNCSIAGGIKQLQGLSPQGITAVTSLLGSEKMLMAARIVINGHVYFSKLYTRMVKRNPCVVQFTDNTIGEISLFAFGETSRKVVAVYKEIEISMDKPFFFDKAGHHVLRVKDYRSDFKAKKVEEILEKVLFLGGNPENPCVVRFPNLNGVCG